MGIFNLLFGFKGRINRGRFWLALLLNFIIVGILLFVVKTATGSINIVAIIAITIFYIWMRLASYVKRLHDINSSGWGALFFFVPLSNAFLFFFTAVVDGTIGDNKYGADRLKQTYSSYVPVQLSLGQLLFSFRGRVSRSSFWFVIAAPIAAAYLFIMPLSIGGILVAQSMIETAKVQSFCRQENNEGKFIGTCKELAAHASIYNKAGTKAKYATPAAYCEEQKALGKLNQSCDEFVQLNSEYEARVLNVTPAPGALNSSGADSLAPQAGGESAATGDAMASMAQAAVSNLSQHKDIAAIIIAIIIILEIPMLWAYISVTAKRLHDRNLSGWWQLLPFSLQILSMILMGVGALSIIGAILYAAAIIGYIAQISICGFIRGQLTANKYGPDPLGNNSSQGVVI